MTLRPQNRSSFSTGTKTGFQVKRRNGLEWTSEDPGTRIPPVAAGPRSSYGRAPTDVENRVRHTIAAGQLRAIAAASIEMETRE